MLVRPYSPEDVDRLFEAGTASKGPGFTEWMPWCHANYSRQESDDFIKGRRSQWEEGREYSLGLFEQETGLLLGGTGINQINPIHQFGNLGYWIRRDRWGRGLVQLAISAACHLAFKHLHLWRVEILVAAQNHNSIRAAEKSGATREGLLRKRLLIGAFHHDAVLFSFVRENVTK